jgi:hypothetical protein
MGINTGSTLLAAELTVVGDNAVNPVLSLSTPVGQSADIVRIKDSTGAVTAAVTSRAAWAGHTDLVMYEDDVIGYADDTVYFY